MLFFSPLCLLAQLGPTPANPPGFQIKQFLQLTDAQFVSVFSNNEQLTRLIAETSRRVIQLRSEIAVETNRPRPDPLELGNRYAEIELVCRFLDTEGTRTVERNVAVLTDAQKARLRSLEEVIRLMPVIAEAQAVRLIEGSPAPLGLTVSPGFGSSGAGGSLSGFLLGQEIFPASACPVQRDFFPLIGRGPFSQAEERTSPPRADKLSR